MNRRQRQGGQVLLMALVVLLLTSIAAALVASSLLLRLRVARQEAAQIHVQALTDAAMAEALASLDLDPAYAGAEIRALGEPGNGFFWSRVSPSAPQRVSVEAGGSFGVFQGSVRAEVSLILSRPSVVAWSVER